MELGAQRWAHRAGWFFYWRDGTAKGLIFFCEPSTLLPCYHTVTLFAALDLKKNIFDTPRHMAVCRSRSIG